MAHKRIIFVLFALIFVFGLSNKVKGQTPAPGTSINFYQYLPLVKTTPQSDVYLKSYSEYVNGSYHYVVGELYNQTNKTFYDAGVNVAIKGQNQSSYRTIRAFIRCLNPHQTTPFKVEFTGLTEPAQVSNIGWSYTGGPNSEYPYCQPAQVDSQINHDDYGTSFWACVSNPSPKEMYGLSVAITFYDSSGTVVGVEKTTYPTLFPPDNHECSFPIEPINTPYRLNQFSSFLIQAEGFTVEGDTIP